MSQFSRHQAALFAAHAAGNYQMALDIALTAHRECPTDHARTWYWQACVHSLLGNTEEALAALHAGLAEGVWFSPRMLDTDTDLDSVRGTRQFAGIREECDRLRKARQAASRPECIVLAPASAIWEQQALLLLHQWGQSARSFAEYWRPLVDEGWTLVAVQSSQPCDSSGFCWDDHDLAQQEIRQHLNDCRRKRGIAPESMIIAGASQGARLALESAHEAGIPWLCVIPSFPTGYDVTSLTAVPLHTRGAFLLGERDPANARTRPVISSLISAGALVEERTMAGIGHELPDDFAVQAGHMLAGLRSRDAMG